MVKTSPGRFQYSKIDMKIHTSSSVIYQCHLSVDKGKSGSRNVHNIISDILDQHSWNSIPHFLSLIMIG